MIDDLHVSYEKLKKICKKTKELGIKEISFEFLVGSCFPNALKNIQEEIRRQYTLGYSQGRKDANDEKQNIDSNTSS